MKEYKFEISLKTESVVEEDILYQFLHDIKARMEGYTTEPIKELNGKCEVSVRYVDIKEERKNKLDNINELQQQ